jgi:hypothetical protein
MWMCGITVCPVSAVLPFVCTAQLVSLSGTDGTRGGCLVGNVCTVSDDGLVWVHVCCIEDVVYAGAGRRCI